MLDWNAYRQELLAGTGEIARMSPDIARGYRVAIAINAGAALVYSARAMDAFAARSAVDRAE